MSDARIGLPFTKAPPPRDAVNISSMAGRYDTPATTSPSTSRPISTAQARFPRTKSRVPSIGSMIQRRPLRELLGGALLAQQSIVGKSLPERARSPVSHSRSATVTGRGIGLRFWLQPGVPITQGNGTRPLGHYACHKVYFPTPLVLFLVQKFSSRLGFKSHCL